jgi:hypothetical protein
MNKRILGWALACCLLVPGQAALAAVFDFPALIDGSSGQISGTRANGTGFGPANPGELGFRTFDWTESGVTLTASATYNGGLAYAYLDAGTAGLGVCRVATSSNQCTPSSDDNVTTGEVLKLSFDKLVSVSMLSTYFRDTDHKLYGSIPDSVQVSIDGGSWTQLNTLTSLVGHQFDLRTTSNLGQFYVSVMDVTAVPEPSTWLLFGLGLLGFILVARRQRR